MRAIEELLPWYAAGTLDAPSARRIEEALAREPKLQAGLRAAREERDEALSLNQDLGAPSARAWARVLAVAETEPRKPTLTARLAAALPSAGSRSARGPARLAWAGAAAALVIVLQGATIVWLLQRAKGPAYETASQQAPALEGATVILAFAPDATLQLIAQALQKHKASIVDGPRSGGLFRVRVGDRTMSKDQFDAVVAALRAEPSVRMALPSSGR